MSSVYGNSWLRTCAIFSGIGSVACFGLSCVCGFFSADVCKGTEEDLKGSLEKVTGKKFLAKYHLTPEEFQFSSKVFQRLYEGVGIHKNMTIMDLYVTLLLKGIENNGLCPGGDFMQTEEEVMQWLQGQEKPEFSEYAEIIQKTPEARQESYMNSASYYLAMEDSALELNKALGQLLESDSEKMETAYNEFFTSFSTLDTEVLKLYRSKVGGMMNELENSSKNLKTIVIS